MLRRFGQGAIAVLTLLAGCSLIAQFNEVETTPPGGGGGTGGGCDTCPGGTDCLVWYCDAGTCVARAKVGEDCQMDGVWYECNDAGECVKCRIDGLHNDKETDVDCGGGDCPKCADTKTCEDPDDCESGVCSAGDPDAGVSECSAPTCSDNVKNGDETGIDCGGTCDVCAVWDPCLETRDCLEGLYCVDEVCCTTPCDGLCEQCVANEGCVRITGFAVTDCPGAGNVCTEEGTCSWCHDSTLNGEETATDCGGTECPPCLEGKDCNVAGDCKSCMCTDGVCTAPICNNGTKDGCESDVDCGGACGPICADGDDCNSKSDCGSGSCVNGKCVGP